METGFSLPTMPSLLVDKKSPFIHRDLSWLQFNDRVLAEARLTTNPILERTKFLAITASNLDEFFMIRFSSLNRSIQQARRHDPKLLKSLTRIRMNLIEAVTQFGRRQTETLDLLAAGLQSHKIFLIRRSKPDDPTHTVGRNIFKEQILPSLTSPEIFSTAQISTLENLQMGVLGDANTWFRIPRSLPLVYFSKQSNGELFVFFLDDLLITHLAEAFSQKSPPGILRMTRDADFSLDLAYEDTESVPDVVKSNLRVRDKGRPVRLQWTGNISMPTLQRSAQYFKFEPGQISEVLKTLCMHGLWGLYHQIPENQSTKNLRFPPLKPFLPRPFRNTEGIFEKLRQNDYLFHHPYDSFDGFVSWIKYACDDPKVETIEQTVYRVDTLSLVVDALKKAAKKKRIRVMIELRARFDELNNLKLADELRQAGVEVGFGFGKLKLHAKVALVTRRESDGLRFYTHLSTGNYNALTARQYTDLAIVTSNQEIGADARHFFDSVWNGKVPSNFRLLVSAPLRLHKKLLSLIDAETEAAKAGRKARIVAKVNALVDEAVIAQLYKASQAGVQVDLIVRGACSLIPGVKGLSENIRVVSIVDRFLEHSRIYYFGDSKALYFSSADWMPRNFFSRLELAFPVLDPILYQYVEDIIIPAYLLDTVKARELTPQGIWKKRNSSSIRPEDKFASSPLKTRKALSAQAIFQEIAEQGYKGTVLSRKE
ncbi:MAG: polyphosphate kinase 1 [Deltaproteobacteria bacterium]|nr:polyphosphate kinase 1 [Deltaproteobacteria bacterium]